MKNQDIFVSVVVPVWNEANLIEGFVRETIAILQENYTYYELVLVDDGSTDATSAAVNDLLRQVPAVRLIRLSRHFGDEIAICAGLEAVIGDFVVTLMPATDPPRLIPDLVTRVADSGGVVVGVKSNLTGPVSVRLGRTLFYWICNRVLGIEVPKHSTHFRALSRAALNALLQIKDKYRYLKVFSTYIGYRHENVLYDPIIRPAGRPRERGLIESIELAFNVMVANSTRLLRLVTWLGVLASGLNLLYMGYIVAIAIFKEDVAEGWITLSAQNAGMFFFLFVILTVLGEYIGRILAESQDRPLYYVMEERNSSVLLLDPERRNVVSESAPYGS